MTKTFRQQNVRRILEIELRGINKNLSKSTFRIINQLSLPSISTATHFYFFLSSFSFNRQFCERKKKGNEIVCAVAEIMEKHKFSHLAMQ